MKLIIIVGASPGIFDEKFLLSKSWSEASQWEGSEHLLSRDDFLEPSLEQVVWSWWLGQMNDYEYTSTPWDQGFSNWPVGRSLPWSAQHEQQHRARWLDMSELSAYGQFRSDSCDLSQESPDRAVSLDVQNNATILLCAGETAGAGQTQISSLTQTSKNHGPGPPAAWTSSIQLRASHCDGTQLWGPWTWFQTSSASFGLPRNTEQAFILQDQFSRLDMDSIVKTQRCKNHAKEPPHKDPRLSKLLGVDDDCF